MRIAADFSFTASGGGVTHFFAWVQHTAALDGENEYLLLAPPRIPEPLRSLPPNFSWHRNILWPFPTAIRQLVYQVWLPLWLAVHRVDVLFSTADRTAVLAPCPVVLLVQNLKPYGGPKPTTPKEWLKELVLRALTSVSARRARHIIFVTGATRDVVCARIGIPRHKTSVVYHGIEDAFFAAPRTLMAPTPQSPASTGEEVSRLAPALLPLVPSTGGAGPEVHLPQPYVLTVGTILPHKELQVLLNGFAELARHPDYARYRLVLVVPPVDRALEARLRARAAMADLRDRVLIVGHVPRPELPAVYQNASVFVSASSIESFGLPLLEALASGIPVVSSDIPAARELCGDAALYFAVGSPPDLAVQLRRLFDDPALAQRLRESGPPRAARFRWDVTARRTLEVLLASGRAGRAGPQQLVHQ